MSRIQANELYRMLVDAARSLPVSSCVRCLLLALGMLMPLDSQAAETGTSPTLLAGAPDRPLNLETYFGINGLGFFHRPDLADETSKRGELIKELGVQWDRSDFWWSEMEPRRGVWDFSVPDRAMRTYRALNVQMLPILNYGAAWRNTQGPADDEQRAEWAEYVRRVVTRYQGYVNTWEVWNEPNIIPFWRPQPDAAAYAKLLEVTAREARAANPEVKLVGFTLAGADHEFLERALQLAGTDDFDIFSYHYYRTNQPEKTTPEEISALRLILRHYGKECPIWVTEQGVTSNLREGVSEELQAVLWMREILLQIGAGVERTFPFTLVDNLSDPGGPWGAELGMVTLDWRRKPVFFAYKTMIAELGGYRFVGSVDLGQGEEIYAYLFRRREAARADEPAYKLAVWSTMDVKDVRIAIDDVPTTVGADAKTKALAPIPAGLTTCTILLGEKRALELDGGTQRFMASPAPVYIPVKNRRLVENARSGFSPGEILASPGGRVEGRLELFLSEAGQGESGRGVDAGQVRFELPSGWVQESSRSEAQTLAAVEGDGESMSGNLLHVTFHVPAESKPGWYSIHADIPTEKGGVRKTLQVWVRPELRARMRPHVTPSAQEVVTSFTIENLQLRESVLWRFTATPPLQDESWLPRGTLAAVGEGTDYVVERTSRVAREVFGQIAVPTKFSLSLLGQGSAVPAEREIPVFRVGVIPLNRQGAHVDGVNREYASRGMLLNEPSQVIRGGWRGEWGGPDDSSAEIDLLLAPEGLYVLAAVTDDHPAMNDQGSGPDVYKGDGVEIYFGPAGYDGSYYAKKESGHYHFALNPGRGGKGALVSDFETEVPGSKIAVQVIEPTGPAGKGRYVMEAFIPKAAFGNYEAAAGDIIALDLQLNDRDDYAAGAPMTTLMWNGDEMNWLRAGKWGLAVVK